MKPIIKHYKSDFNGEVFDSVDLELNEVISFKVEHWEGCRPILKIHLCPKQFKALYKEMAKFYTKKVT